MAKKFGLSELERAAGKLGIPLDAPTVKVMQIAAAVMGGRWTVADEVKAAKVAAEAQANILRQEAALARGNARKQAEELRRRAATVETAASYAAANLEATAKEREGRANQLAGYSALIK